jgi:fusion and transport protein UGO1
MEIVLIPGGSIGTNATFIHSVLVSAMETWTTSFISAVLSLPDPGVTDIADSTHPMASLAVAVAASTLTALLLSPLDVIRTKSALFLHTIRIRS